MRVSRSVMAAGGVVLAGMLLGFTNPKAVHAAVTALFVQVTNTASNPVVTQGIGVQAANMVHLRCLSSPNAGYDAALCNPVDATGGTTVTTGYIVPSGHSLIITSIDIREANGSSCAGDYMGYLTDTSGQPTWFLVVSGTKSSVITHISYPSGVAIGGGRTLEMQGYLTPPAEESIVSCSGNDIVEIYGYLTAA